MTHRLEQVNPVLPVRDVSAAVDFYVSRLGFAPAYPDVPQNTRYAVIKRDGVELHLQWHDAAEWERVERPLLRFRVQDVEALFEEYKTKDIFHAKTALRETPWGTREFAFFDPEQNGLTFYEA